MLLMEAVRQRILDLCKERNLTVTGLSTLCGINQSTLENIVKLHYKSTTLSTLQKICDGLEIDLPTFFESSMFDDLEPYNKK